MSTYQNASALIPVVANDPPVEGPGGTQIVYNFSSTILTASATYQMLAQGGLYLSQVVTLIIDNTLNTVPITVTHGVFNTATSVDAGAASIVPTFSNRGPYNIAIECLATPTAPGVVTITYMNYEKNPTGWSLTQAQASTPIGTLFSGEVDVTAAGNTTILTTGNYSISTIAWSVISITNTNAGTDKGQATLKYGSPGTVLGTLSFNFMASSGLNTPTITPFNQTYSTPLVITNAALILDQIQFNFPSGANTIAYLMTITGIQN